MHLRNVVTAARNPSLICKYADWRVQRFLHGDAITKVVRDAVTIGGFSGFSEYLAVDEFLHNGEFIFFRDYPFGKGAFIDLGANVGVHSLFLAKRFPDRPVYAIEASPYTMATFRRNIEINDARNVRCCEVAISDKEGFVTFNADPVARGTAGITQHGGTHAIEVPCQSLDQFVRDNAIGPIAAIKIDVEGYEAAVLRGAQKLLSQAPPPVIYLEIHPAAAQKAGFEPEEPVRLLLDAGYEMLRPNSKGELSGVGIEEVKHIESENWIALQAGKA